MATQKIVFRSRLFCTLLLVIISQSISAQTTLLSAPVDPPTEITASPQPWLVHQDWFCPPKTAYDPNKYALSMRARMNALGANGWELVSFSQTTVTVVNAACYVATYKAPRKRS